MTTWDSKWKFQLINKLDDDWIKNIEEALETIIKFTPGISIKWETWEQFLGYGESNIIFITTNEDDEAFTEGNIFTDSVCKISFWNDWKWHRQGTALHEILHALGFHHEQSRKDRDNFLKVKDMDDENYSIILFSQELTPFDPFSVMLYNETEEMERKGKVGIWKLK